MYLSKKLQPRKPVNSLGEKVKEGTHTSAALSMTFSTLSTVKPCSLYVSVNKVADELKASVI